MSTGPAALHPFGCAPGRCWGTLDHFIPALNLTLSLLSCPVLVGCSSQLCADTQVKKKPQHMSKQQVMKGGAARATILHAGTLAGWL